MHDTQRDTNYNAFTYASAISQKLNELSIPLFQTFELKNFGYKRVFKNGHYLFLSTNQYWLKYHLKDIHTHGPYFMNAMNVALKIEGYHRVLWPTSSHFTDHFLQALNNFGMWNGLNFYKKTQDFIELWTFSTSPDKYQDPNAFLSIISYLERFIIYFNVTMADSLNNFEPRKLALCHDHEEIFFPLSQPYNYSRLENFLQQTSIKKLPIYIKEKVFYLSPQETQCAKLILLGKSVKEISNSLNLSPRTVEGYLKNVKIKIGCPHKSSLINTLTESLIRLGYMSGP